MSTFCYVGTVNVRQQSEQSQGKLNVVQQRDWVYPGYISAPAASAAGRAGLPPSRPRSSAGTRRGRGLSAGPRRPGLRRRWFPCLSAQTLDRLLHLPALLSLLVEQSGDLEPPLPPAETDGDSQTVPRSASCSIVPCNIVREMPSSII